MTHHSTIARALARLSIALLATLLLVAPATAKQTGDHGKGKKDHANEAAAHRKNDRDHMANGWEKKHGLNPQADDSAEDPDADGLANLGEFRNRTDPQDADTDGDGFTDGDEVLDGFDPTDAEDNLEAEEAEDDGDGDELEDNIDGLDVVDELEDDLDDLE